MIEVEIKGLGKVINHFHNYSKEIPKAANKGMWNLARYGQKVTKEEMRRAGIESFSDRLYPSVQAVKINKNNYAVKMVKYGLYLDKMRTHTVALKRGRKITKWAKDKGFQGRYITVHKHPFSRMATFRIVQKAKEIIEKEVNNSIKQGGR